jgi:hypothetical protein
MGKCKLILPRATGCHRGFDPPYADAHQSAEFQQLQPDRAAGGVGELGVRQADAAERVDQHIGNRGKPQAELVGAHGGGRGAVGEQIELAFLDAVLDLATRAVDLLIEAPTVDLTGLQRRDDEARVGLVASHLGLADDAAFVARAWRRSTPPSPSPTAADCAPGQTRSPHTIVLAPRHQDFAGKARIAAQQDARPRPAAADLGHDPCHFLDYTGRPIDVRPPQLRGQQMSTAEHVERQVAVAIIIAVEEPAFLLPVQRIVRRIQVQDDLRRCLGMCLQEQIDQQPLDRCGVVTDPVIPRCLGPAQLQPVQRALAGDRRAISPAGFELTSQDRHHRVVAQLVVAADVAATMQEDFEQADDARIMKLDAGMADCADGDGEGEPLQQREVNMDVEPLRLEAGEAICEGEEPLAHGIEMIQSLPEMEIGEIV